MNGKPFSLHRYENMRQIKKQAKLLRHGAVKTFGELLSFWKVSIWEGFTLLLTIFGKLLGVKNYNITFQLKLCNFSNFKSQKLILEIPIHKQNLVLKRFLKMSLTYETLPCPLLLLYSNPYRLRYKRVDLGKLIIFWG